MKKFMLMSMILFMTIVVTNAGTFFRSVDSINGTEVTTGEVYVPNFIQSSTNFHISADVTCDWKYKNPNTGLWEYDYADAYVILYYGISADQISAEAYGSGPNYTETEFADAYNTTSTAYRYYLQGSSVIGGHATANICITW